MKDQFSVKEAVAQLEKETERFTIMMQHGTVKVEYYAPQKTDRQTPHRQDELYVIISGSGIFFVTDIALTLQPVMFYLCRQAQSIALKTLQMILLPGLFFMERKVVKESYDLFILSLKTFF
jgi:hypothetical protein